MQSSRTPLLLTFALVAACGNGQREGGTEPDTTAPRPAAIAPDTLAIPPVEPTLAPVVLPADFPSDFPLPPGHTVIEANANRDASGVFSTVTLVVASTPDEQQAWYRQALFDAGWQIAAEGRSDGARTLHATQGESYIDLSIRPHPEAGGEGRVLVDASIWKLEGL